ncbi:STAS domain-containing protein [Haloferula chungangensis]|uniref:STAS domain-containing protein n=1 Tax=Haloferula chungangensis TaxID=1048331 RepID=A0ABW2L1A8_9BACT
MSQEIAISFGTFDEFTWIRCEGKGSFLQSPALKECAEKHRNKGETHFVIDLEACTGMDSTFMGFLAGLASRVGKDGGAVMIASPGEKNRRSLEGLGLDCLLDIAPDDASWVGKEEEIRGKLTPFRLNRLPDIKDRAQHVLESHQTLAATSDDNAKRFATVLQVLEQDAAKHSDKES